MLPTYAERFCQHRGVPVSAYRREILRPALYPHARCLRPLLFLLDHNAHSLDDEFVGAVGAITQLGELAATVADFVWHPVNFTFWRQTLRVRVSVARLRQRVVLVMGGAPDASGSVAAPQSSTAARRLA